MTDKLFVAGSTVLAVFLFVMYVLSASKVDVQENSRGIFGFMHFMASALLGVVLLQAVYILCRKRENEENDEDVLVGKDEQDLEMV